MDHLDHIKKSAIEGVKLTPEGEKTLIDLRCFALECAVATASIGERAQANSSSVIWDAEKFYEFLTSRP